jgi:hypothetical protein
MKNAFLLAVALQVAASPILPAWAGNVTATLPITIQAPLVIVFTPPNPTIPCNAAPGTVVAALSVTGGDGNPATYTASSGDTTDFAVAPGANGGANVAVGSAGIAAANCGTATGPKIENVGITASQP